MSSIRIESGQISPSPMDWSQDPDRGWAVAVHLIALFFSLLGAIIVNLAVGKRSAFVNQHARQAISFQLNAGLAVLVTGALGAFLPPLLLLWIPLAVAYVVIPIVAAVRANRGEWNGYPPMLPLPSSLPEPS